jgi:hypothetical protein
MNGVFVLCSSEDTRNFSWPWFTSYSPNSRIGEGADAVVTRKKWAELAVAELAVAELAVAELAVAELAVAELAVAELAVAELAVTVEATL